MSETAQIIMAILGLASSAFTTWRGFAAVAAKLTNYVPVETYLAKVTELHEQINLLRIEMAVLKERAK